MDEEKQSRTPIPHLQKAPQGVGGTGYCGALFLTLTTTKAHKTMKRGTTTALGSLLATMALGLASVSAAEKIDADPKHQLPRPDNKAPDTKRPVKVFILLSELGKYYPGAEQCEVAGFVWWQGHKDQNPAHASRYELNLVNLIKSLRKDFNAPNAPFVLAVGCGNPGRTSFGLQIAEAQLAMNDTKKHPEFAGNVKCVDSRDFWREADVSPKNQGYHYNRNAETYMEVGNALGWAMADLLKK